MIINGWEYNTIANALAMAYPTTLEALQILSVRSYAPPPSLEAAMRRRRLVPHYTSALSPSLSTLPTTTDPTTTNTTPTAIVLPSLSFTEQVIDSWQYYIVDPLCMSTHEIGYKLLLLLTCCTFFFMTLSPLSYYLYTRSMIEEERERWITFVGDGGTVGGESESEIDDRFDGLLEQEETKMILTLSLTGFMTLSLLISGLIWLYALVIVVHEQQQRHQHHQVTRQGASASSGSSSSGGGGGGGGSSSDIANTLGHGAVRRMSFTSMLER